MKTLKNIIKGLIIVISISTFTACEKWDLVGLRGNGSVVTNDVILDEVEGIKLEIPATVNIQIGEEQSISIDAQQNVFDNMIKSSSNNVFTLSFDKNVAKCEAIVVNMTVTDINRLEIAGAGEILLESKVVTTDEVKIKVSGSGEIVADIDAPEMDIEISGSGKVTLQGNYQELNAEITGSGDINLEDGFATYTDFKTSGSGDFNAFDFLTEDCDIEIIGSGDSRVNVTDKLTVEIMGSGDVYYKGNPRINSEVYGSGEIKSAN